MHISMPNTKLNHQFRERACRIEELHLSVGVCWVSLYNNVRSYYVKCPPVTTSQALNSPNNLETRSSNKPDDVRPEAGDSS